MRWQGRRQSDNVEDLRGEQGGGAGGGFGRGGGLGGPGFRIVRGGGISGILILVVMFFVQWASIRCQSCSVTAAWGRA